MWLQHSEAIKDWAAASAAGGVPLVAYLADFNVILTTVSLAIACGIGLLRLRHHWVHRNDKE